MTRVGEMGVKVAEQQNDLVDTKEDLAESNKSCADLEVNFENNWNEWAMTLLSSARRHSQVLQAFSR